MRYQKYPLFFSLLPLKARKSKTLAIAIIGGAIQKRSNTPI
jgi:hypothetical protein